MLSFVPRLPPTLLLVSNLHPTGFHAGKTEMSRLMPKPVITREADREGTSRESFPSEKLVLKDAALERASTGHASTADTPA